MQHATEQLVEMRKRTRGIQRGDECLIFPLVTAFFSAGVTSATGWRWGWGWGGNGCCECKYLPQINFARASGLKKCTQPHNLSPVSGRFCGGWAGGGAGVGAAERKGPGFYVPKDPENLSAVLLFNCNQNQLERHVLPHHSPGRGISTPNKTHDKAFS